VVPAAASPVFAASAIDQSYTADFSFDFVSQDLIAAQTYTAGETGIITAVDLGLQRVDSAGTLAVSIQTTSGGVPTGTVLASATVAQSAVADDGETHVVDVPLTPVLQTLGTTYAIVLAAPAAANDTDWLWTFDSTNGYAGGTALVGNSGTNVWTIKPTDDRTFATWVDTTPCAPGFFSATGFGTCTPADAGHFAAGPGATAQLPCDLGTYQPDPGQPACLPAPVGSYVDVAGATSATPCPDGTTTDAPGATSAAACLVNAPPPTIACSATPKVLWPPNNKLVSVAITVTASTPTFRLVSVTANEGTAADMTGWSIGTADVAGQLRASRSGGGSGRTYSLTYEAASASGQTAQCTATVLVPHDQGARYGLRVPGRAREAPLPGTRGHLGGA